MKKIIYDKNGVFGISIPSKNFIKRLMSEHPDWDEERAIKHIADKDLPTGTKYSIVTPEELIETFGMGENGSFDTTFFDAWEYSADETSLTSGDLSQEYLDKYNMKEQCSG